MLPLCQLFITETDSHFSKNTINDFTAVDRFRPNDFQCSARSAVGPFGPYRTLKRHTSSSAIKGGVQQHLSNVHSAKCQCSSVQIPK